MLRSPKGWTGPREVDGKKIEGRWRSHPVPFSEVKTSASLSICSSNGCAGGKVRATNEVTPEASQPLGLPKNNHVFISVSAFLTLGEPVDSDLVESI